MASTYRSPTTLEPSSQPSPTASNRAIDDFDSGGSTLITQSYLREQISSLIDLQAKGIKEEFRRQREYIDSRFQEERLHTDSKFEEHGHVLEEHGHVLEEHGHLLKEHGHVLEDHGHLLKEHGHQLKEHGHKIKEQGHQIKEQTQRMDDIYIAINTQRKVADAKEIVAEAKDWNRRATHLWSTLHPIAKVDKITGEAFEPQDFPSRAGTFWRLKKRNSWNRLLYLIEFYEIGSWESWGLESLEDESDEENSRLAPAHRSLRESVMFAPERALQELALAIGLDYDKLSANIPEDEQILEGRSTRTKRTHESDPSWSRSAKRSLRIDDAEIQRNQMQQQAEVDPDSALEERVRKRREGGLGKADQRHLEGARATALSLPPPSETSSDRPRTRESAETQLGWDYGALPARQTADTNSEPLKNTQPPLRQISRGSDSSRAPRDETRSPMQPQNAPSPTAQVPSDEARRIYDMKGSKRSTDS